MTERPILMSGPMVRALLAGTKTQTRRIVKPQPVRDGDMWGHAALAGLFAEHVFGACMVKIAPCPYGQPGDRLWVRETFAAPWGLGYRMPGGQSGIFYRADDERKLEGDGPWSPAIHMPRKLCRLVLDLTAVRVERLQDISEEDAKAEGAEPWDDSPLRYRVGYERLWNSINAKHGFGWGINPWCWVLTFKRIEEARKAA